MVGGHGGLLREFVSVRIALLNYKEVRILTKTTFYQIQFCVFRSNCEINLALGSFSIHPIMKKCVGVFILLEESFKNNDSMVQIYNIV